MTMYIYTIYDARARECNGPSIFKNDEVAWRQYEKQKPQMDFPEDQTLLNVGTFNTETGEILALEPTPVTAILEYADEKEEGI